MNHVNAHETIRNEYWIKIRQTINSREEIFSRRRLFHPRFSSINHLPPATEKALSLFLFFSLFSSFSLFLSRGISRGKRRVESDSRKRNSLTKVTRECIRFSSPFSPFSSFFFFLFHWSIDNLEDRFDGQTFARDPSGRFQSFPNLSSLSVLRLEGRRGRRRNKRG